MTIDFKEFLKILPPIAPGKIRGTPAVVSWLISPGVIVTAAPSVLGGWGLILTMFGPEKIIWKPTYEVLIIVMQKWYKGKNLAKIII